jgi:hypothetical protein
MRVAFIFTTLMLFASLSGCLGDDQPDYSGFEGCTEEDVQCETDLPEGNQTVPEGNETNNGTWEGERVPQVTTLARAPSGIWTEWQLSDYIDETWNNTTKMPWILIEFASTDCSHCWNYADDMELLHNQYRDNVTFFTFAVNFSSNDNFNASLEEIAAFQDKTTFEGCYYGTKNCDERPGPAHNWTYVDDRDQSEMATFHSQGTPMFVIIQPDGIVVWHQYQNDDESVVDALAALFPAEG